MNTIITFLWRDEKSNSNAKHSRRASSEIPFLFCSCRNRHATIELSACGMNIPLRNFDWRPEAAIRPAKSRSGAVAHTLMLLLMVQSTCHMEISLAWDLPRGHANHFGLVLCVYISKLEELEVPSLIEVHI